LVARFRALPKAAINDRTARASFRWWDNLVGHCRHSTAITIMLLRRQDFPVPIEEYHQWIVRISYLHELCFYLFLLKYHFFLKSVTAC